jgi:hypothetical protein
MRKPPSFPQNRHTKSAGAILYILCLEGGLVSPKQALKTACAAPWRIFSSNKIANRKNEGIREDFV